MDKFGFIRENRLANIYIVRETKEIREPATEISINNDEWKVISNADTENETRVALASYTRRSEMINEIVLDVMGQDLRGVVIDFTGVNTRNLERFLIELTPRLREIGLSTGILSSSDANNEEMRNIIDYIAR